QELVGAGHSYSSSNHRPRELGRSVDTGQPSVQAVTQRPSVWKSFESRHRGLRISLKSPANHSGGTVMFDTFAKNTLVPLILRAGLAVIFVFHGLGKVNAETEWGWSWHPGGQDAMAGPLQMAVAWGELVGGIALGLGLLTRLAALGIAAIMAG